MTMIKERFLRDSAVYKKFVGDSSDGSAKYDEFSLTHVLVQRKSLINKSGEKHGSLVLYFFPEFRLMHKGRNGFNLAHTRGERQMCS